MHFLHIFSSLIEFSPHVLNNHLTPVLLGVPQSSHDIIRRAIFTWLIFQTDERTDGRTNLIRMFAAVILSSCVSAQKTRHQCAAGEHGVCIQANRYLTMLALAFLTGLAAMKNRFVLLVDSGLSDYKQGRIWKMTSCKISNIDVLGTSLRCSTRADATKTWFECKQTPDCPSATCNYR
jgi:hypothetical protein